MMRRRRLIGVSVASLAAAAAPFSWTWDWDFTASETPPAELTSSGGTNGTRTNSSGYVVSGTAPRYDYTGAGVAQGLLGEGARTNVALQSAAWATTPWSDGLGAVTADAATGPDNAANADRFTDPNSAAAGNPYTGQALTVTTLLTYVLSAYQKGTNCQWVHSKWNGYDTVNQRVWFDLTNGAVGTADSPLVGRIVAAANGFYRTIVRGFTTTTDVIGGVRFHISEADNDQSYTMNGKYYDGWGAQAEVGDCSSSYIPTTTASVTRTQDVNDVTGTNFSNDWSATVGTLVVGFDSPGIGTRTILQADDGTADHRIVAWTTGTTLKVDVIAGGVSQTGGGLTVGTITAHTAHTLSIKWEANNLRASLDGGSEVSDLSVTLPTGLTNLKLHRSLTAGEELFGHIRTLKYDPSIVA